MKIVIIGASNNRERFSNKAVRAYLEKGYVVYPVNPNEDEVEGLRCYHHIRDVPNEVDVASSYVRPEILRPMVQELVELGIKEIYLNPGAESDDLVHTLTLRGITPIVSCSITAIGVTPTNY